MRALLFTLLLAQRDLQAIDVLAISNLLCPISQAVWLGVVVGDVFLARSLSAHWPCIGSPRGDDNILFLSLLSVVRFVSLLISSECAFLGVYHSWRTLMCGPKDVVDGDWLALPLGREPR